MSVPMPSGDRTQLLADWVEMQIAGHGGDLPMARLRRLLRAEGTELADEEFNVEDGDDLDLAPEDDLEHEDESLADEADDQLDVHLDLLRSEIDDRASIAALVYPFEIVDDRLTRRDACGEDVYLLLLVLGARDLPYRRERRAHEVEETYDLLVLAALRRWMGEGAEGVRFARTARTDEAKDDRKERPTSFPEAIAWLARLMGFRDDGVRAVDEQPDQVMHWEDEADVDDVPAQGRSPLTSYNDGGVDVVAWRHWGDRRPGFPVFLAQCTVQLTWPNKLEDIKLSLWTKWIDWPVDPPQRAMVIPFVETGSPPQWLDRTTRGGMIIDRRRLLEMLAGAGCDELEAMVDQRTRRWVRTELAAA